MLLHTALVAVRPNSSLNAPGAAIPAVFETQCRCHFACSYRFFAEVEALTVGMVFCRAFGRGKHGDSYGSFECHPVRIPSSSRDHASGPFRRPAARRRSASPAAPLRGLGSSQNKFVNARQRAPHKLLPGPAKKALLGTWEPGPLAWLRLV